LFLVDDAGYSNISHADCSIADQSDNIVSDESTVSIEDFLEDESEEEVRIWLNIDFITFNIKMNLKKNLHNLIG